MSMLINPWWPQCRSVRLDVLYKVALLRSALGICAHISERPLLSFRHRRHSLVRLVQPRRPNSPTRSPHSINLHLCRLQVEDLPT